MNAAALSKLRSKFAAGSPAYGLWVTLESPSITEMAVSLGFDWVVIDAEHGHLDWKEIVEHLRGAVRSETVVLVRLAENSEALIKRALDIGADGVVIPWIETRDQLEAAVRSAHYPPGGRRGIGAERATCWGTCFPAHVQESEPAVMVVPLIESVAGTENAAELVKVEGVETFFFGPADLSATAGFPGEWEGQGVPEKIAGARDIFTAAGKTCGVVARSDEDLAGRAKQGFRMLGVGLDAGLLIRTLKQSLGSVGLQRTITPGFTLERDYPNEPEVCAPDSFRPDRSEVMNPLGQKIIDLGSGVSFDCQVGAHNGAVRLTTGIVTFAPGAVLATHRHVFGESITVLEGLLQVTVEGRMYKVGPLDNVSVPAGLAHKAQNISRDGPTVVHVAMCSSTPDRELVEAGSSRRSMQTDRTYTHPGGERFTSFHNSDRYEPGPNASFVDYFNAELMPGFDMSGGYGTFQPGGRLPAHLHDFDESICIVEGDATCWVEGRRYEMGDMTTALQPRGRIHYFINRTNAPMAMIWVYAGPMPERVVVDEKCAREPGRAWGPQG